MDKIFLYDATLREGNQTEEIAFSIEDKLLITAKLDEIGIDFIEGGWPSSNPKDFNYFREVKALNLQHAVVTAFGSTAKPGIPVEKDVNLNDLLNAGTEAVTIFGKTWDLHVTDVLGIQLDENLELVEASVQFLKQRLNRVLFDAEHFFDGYKANPEYALKVLERAVNGGAEYVVLCDTNGGTLPFETEKIVSAVKERISVPLGIHTHNDCDVAVANSISAVRCGCTQVQGTINGYGERCGNANLCSIIPDLQIKLGLNCMSADGLKKLSEASRYVSELSNLQPLKHQPFVGDSAFAHKAGVHVSAVQKNPAAYEHIIPELVGNTRRVLVSDQAGRSNILQKAREFALDLEGSDPRAQNILSELKNLEKEGFQFEGAEASFELLMRKAIGLEPKYFDLIGFRVIIERREECQLMAEATIMVRVGDKIEHTAALGNGPVNAIDNALRKALEKFYPQLKNTSLIDYKVRVLSSGEGTRSRVRVLIESGDEKDKWGTVGVSADIIEASWQSLTDSIIYKLLKDERWEKNR